MLYEVITIRNKVRKGVEQFARRRGAGAVTSGIISEALAADDRSAAFAAGRPDRIAGEDIV